MKTKDIQFNTTTTQPAYTIRYENHQGRRHLVIPVVMMAEGVHCGSHGPVYHTSDELGRHPSAWNGIPVLVNHPARNGENVSANDPTIVESEVLGRVYNAHFDDSDNRLKGEVWLDEAVLQFRQPELLAHLIAGRPMDVSIGAFTDDEPTEGAWNGETYTAISHNYRPDHLALLPHARGACSWADGCGLRANSAFEDIDNGGNAMDKQLWKAFQAAGFHITPTQTREVQVNEVGYLELVRGVQSKLDSMDNEAKLHFLEELFDDGTFVYRISTSDSRPAQYYRRGYTIDAQGQVEFNDEITQVKRQVEYVAVPQVNAEQKTTKFVRTKGEGKMGTNTETKPCGCPDKVTALLAMEHFTEDDRSWLEKLDNAGLDRLIAVHTAMGAPTAPAEEDPPAPEVNKEQAPAVKKDPKPQLNEAEYLDQLPEGLKHQMEYGMKLYREHRATLKQSILDNTDVYSEEELELQTDEALEKLAKIVKPTADYSVAGGQVQSNTSADDVLLPPGVVASK